MPVEERPAEAPFGKKGERNIDHAADGQPDPRQSGEDFERSGSSSLMVPDVGHFVVVQLGGHKNNPYIDEIIGVFHSLTAADMYASKDRGLKIYPAEVLG